MQINYCKLRVFIREKDMNNYKNIKRKFFEILSIQNYQKLNKNKKLDETNNFTNNKYEFHELTTIGFENKKIKIISFKVKNKKSSLLTLKNILKNLLIEDLLELKLSADSRIDNFNKYYIRLDIKSLLDNKYKLVDHGRCYHLTFAIATYPKSKDKAIKVVINLINKQININKQVNEKNEKH